MKFKFRLETLLKHRGRLKEDAQIIFREIQHRVFEKKREIGRQYKEIEKTRNWIGRQEAVGEISGITQAATYIKYVKIDIENKKQELKELELESDEKNELLIEASREEAVLIKLKEKKRDEFKMMYNRLEQKRIDDLISMRHRRRS